MNERSDILITANQQPPNRSKYSDFPYIARDGQNGTPYLLVPITGEALDEFEAKGIKEVDCCIMLE